MAITIWKAYCDISWRAAYERLLKASGMSSIKSKRIMEKFGVYINRIKDCAVIDDLYTIQTREEFSAKLNWIFNTLWKYNIQENYADMYDHFMAYLKFLDSLQAIKGEFFNEEEEKRLNIIMPTIPLESLSEYELPYLKNGKLTILNNPVLLSWLRNSLKTGLVKTSVLPNLCKKFYGDLLPNMKPADYTKLIETIWTPEGKSRGVRRNNQITIVYPDGIEKVLGSLDTLKAVILYYGLDVVYSKRLAFRDHDLLVKTMQLEKDKYDPIDNDYLVLKTGNLRDRYTMINLVNRICGERLKISLE